MRTPNLFFALFLAVVLVGCNTSEANDEEQIVAELRDQMESIERDVAKAVGELDERGDEISEDVRARIDEARIKIDLAQQKLDRLHEASRGDDQTVERERIRINVKDHKTETVTDGTSDRYSADGDYDHDKYHSSGDHQDHDLDIDIEIDEEAIHAAVSGIGATLERLGEALKNDADVVAVDMDDLRDLFPGEVAGMKRVNMNSSREGAFGFRVSQTEAEYRGEHTDLSLTVVDLGSLGGLAQSGFDLMDIEDSKKSDDGYVRTMKIGGYPAKLQFEKGRRQDNLDVAIMIANRFVLAFDAKGTDLSEQLLEDVLDDFPLDAIADLDQR
jgi:hypothetical protein